jgi:hypothetical protein
MTNPTGSIPISLIWPDVDEQSVYRANQFLGQLSPGPGPDGAPEEFVLTIGYVSPPVMLGSAEEQAATMNALGAVSVRTLARVSMSRGRLQELIGILQQSASNYDVGSGGQPG